MDLCFRAALQRWRRCFRAEGFRIGIGVSELVFRTEFCVSVLSCNTWVCVSEVGLGARVSVSDLSFGAGVDAAKREDLGCFEHGVFSQDWDASELWCFTTGMPQSLDLSKTGRLQKGMFHGMFQNLSV